MTLNCDDRAPCTSAGIASDQQTVHPVEMEFESWLRAAVPKQTGAHEHLCEGGAGGAGAVTACSCLVGPADPDTPVPGQEGGGRVDAAIVDAPAAAAV